MDVIIYYKRFHKEEELKRAETIKLISALLMFSKIGFILWQ